MGDQIAEVIQKTANEMETQVQINGPAPAPVEKLRGQFRFHILIQADLDAGLQPVIAQATRQIKQVDDVQWIADIDPQDML